MGVSYKLTDEIIDYIVQNKRTFPALSCRQLVSKITEKFRMDVSKSSVNDVIKEYKLSNPVGRQPRIKPAKNFSIPKEKKDILLKKVIPFLAIDENSTFETPKIPDIESIENNDLSKKTQEVKGAEGPGEFENNVQSKIELTDHQPVNNVHLLPDSVSRIKDQTLPIYSRLGSSVLWFALCSMADTARLGGIICKWSRLMECDPEMALAVPLLPFFNNDPLKNSEDGLLALWKICGAGQFQISKLQSAAHLFHQLPQAQADFLKEIQKSEILVKGFSIKTNSGKEFHLTTQSFFLYENDKYTENGLGWPVFSAVKRIVDQVITNIMPIEVEYCGCLSDNVLADFIIWNNGSYDGSSILEIYDGNQKINIDLGSIPMFRRNAVIKVKLTENEAEMFESGIEVQNNVFWDEITHQNIYYKESLFRIKNLKEPQTIITFDVLAEKAFFILLNKNITTLKCAYDYAQKGSFKESKRFFHSGIDTPQKKSKDIIERLEGMIFGAMHSFEKQENLASRDIWNAFYQLPGRIIYGGDRIYLQIIAPDKYLYQRILPEQIKAINRSFIGAVGRKRVMYIL